MSGESEEMFLARIDPMLSRLDLDFFGSRAPPNFDVLQLLQHLKKTYPLSLETKEEEEGKEETAFLKQLNKYL